MLTEKQKEYNKIHSKKYYLTHKKQIAKYKKEWVAKNIDSVRKKKSAWYFANRPRIIIKRDKLLNIRRFGGNRQKALEKDSFSCNRCGLNNEQHIVIFGKGLHVHHIDKNKQNNELNNLVSLCVRCHSIVHGGEI